MGCTHSPIFDAVPVENFIISMLHIIIGIGNSLLDIFFEWIEWRIEQLSEGELLHRNTVCYVEVESDHVKQKYDSWIENEGIMLGNKVYNKAQLSKQLSAKVSIAIGS
jgi:hypothetical protein